MAKRWNVIVHLSNIRTDDIEDFKADLLARIDHPDVRTLTTEAWLVEATRHDREQHSIRVPRSPSR